MTTHTPTFRTTIVKGALLSLAALLFTSIAAAQETPKAELFAGYSYLRVNPTGLEGVNTNGWEASLAYNFNRHFGLKGEFGGDYCCDDQHIHTFMGGPQVSWRGKKANVFVHGLVGGAHVKGSITDTSVAWAAGGGLDWNINEHFAWRIAQADYVGTHSLDNIQHNFRISTGLVFRFGK